MNIVHKTLRKSKEEYFKMHLHIINTLVSDEDKMVNKEIEVLATFMSLEKALIEEDMFNSLARKQVKEKLKLSAGGLGNHLKSLILKKHLAKNEITGRITVNPAIIPGEPIQGYQIKLIQENGN